MSHEPPTDLDEPEFNDLLEEFSDEIDGIDPEIQVKETKEPEDTEHGLEVKEVEVIQPVLATPGDRTADYEETRLQDGTQYHITVRKRKQCPNCNYTPQHPRDRYEELPELKGRCRNCQQHTCTECNTSCQTCDRTLCSDCSDGYGAEDHTLCYRHRQDVVEERQFEAKVELLEQERKDEQLRHKKEMDKLKFQLQQRKQALKEEIRRNKDRIQLFKAWSQHVDRVEKRELEKRKFELEEELERRKQNLREFETQAKLELQKEKQEFEHEYKQEKLDLEQQKLDQQRIEHDDKIQFKKEKELFQQQIKAEKHELSKISQLLSVAERLDRQDNPGRMQKKLGKAAKDLASNDQSWMMQQL